MRIPTLDVRGLRCPLPALFARRAMARAAAGSTLEVISDDPLAAVDLPHMCQNEGIDIVGIDPQARATRFILRRRV